MPGGIPTGASPIVCSSGSRSGGSRWSRTRGSSSLRCTASMPTRCCSTTCSSRRCSISRRCVRSPRTRPTASASPRPRSTRSSAATRPACSACKGVSMALALLIVLTLLGAPVAAQEPVRVGVLTIRSGPIASCGRQMEDGLQFGLKERGGAIAGQKVGYKRIATIADDFAYGHEHTGGFQRTFEENGGKIVQKLWPPIATPDYGTFIAQIKPNVDAIYAGFGPTNGQRFLKQYKEFGLKLPVLGMVTTTEESSLKSMGDEALGVITAGTYSAALDTPTNRKWVQAMRAEYKDDPGYCTIGGYLGVLFLEAGMKAVNGRVEDKAAFMKALRAVSLPDTPQGPIHLDAYGNPIVNVYIRRVERRDGRLMNVVIDTYREVSQFWKYDPATFLAAPVYSRDYPPAKNIE